MHVRPTRTSRRPHHEAARMIELSEAGLYCPAGGFYIDPWGSVDRAVITHAHGDHLRWGSRSYLVCEPGRRLAEARLGMEVDSIPYGKSIDMNGVRVSLHPAGHVLGS